jgi:CheY-like chemotaxis protein
MTTRKISGDHFYPLFLLFGFWFFFFFLVLCCDDSHVHFREISSMIRAIQPEIEVLSAQDGIDGLVLLKSNAEDVRWCLCDMVMPGLSGIELLNRARVDPALKHVTFALMTEFSAGKETNSSRKTLSHFQVSDDRGEPVSVMIKPLHAVLIEEMLKSVPLPGVSLVRKHSESTLLNAGMEADPDWARTRSRSDWAKRSEVPAIVAPTTPDNQSPRSSSRTTSPGAEGSLSPRGAGPSTTARRTGLPSSLEGLCFFVCVLRLLLCFLMLSQRLSSSQFYFSSSRFWHAAAQCAQRFRNRATEICAPEIAHCVSRQPGRVGDGDERHEQLSNVVGKWQKQSRVDEASQHGKRQSQQR